MWLMSVSFCNNNNNNNNVTTNTQRLSQDSKKAIYLAMRAALCITTIVYLHVLQQYFLFAAWSCVENFYIVLNITNIAVILSTWRSLITLSCHPSGTFLSLLVFYIPSSANNLTIKRPAASDHSAPRSWQERDFCLRNFPTSRSRGYRGTRLDRKRLAREVMLSRWPPLMSSPLVPGGQGDWPLASRTAHSSSSGVRWSREAEISRYRQL